MYCIAYSDPLRYRVGVQCGFNVGFFRKHARGVRVAFADEIVHNDGIEITVLRTVSFAPISSGGKFCE